jgi:diacylglycerol diphosphate phosphatase/phosphatidate phosphatase
MAINESGSGCYQRFFTQHTYDVKPLFSSPGARLKFKNAIYAFDWIFMIAAFATGGALWVFIPVRQHLFRIDDPVLSYPIVPQTINTWELILISFIVPIILMFVISVVFVKSLHDFHHAVLGLLQAQATSLLLICLVKIFLGGLRPNFLARCFAPTGVPDPLILANATRHGFNGVYYDTSICTGPKLDVNDAQAAFPSGHSALAAAGLTFFSLYLNAKFKTFEHRGHLWIYVMVTAAMFGSFLVGFSRIVDYQHTPYNVAMGLTIGFFNAFCMYRLNYLSLFGKYNHVPVADHWFFRSMGQNAGYRQVHDTAVHDVEQHAEQHNAENSVIEDLTAPLVR